MTVRPTADRARLDDLLINRALLGLTEQERGELDTLLSAFPDVDEECMDRATAALDIVFTGSAVEPLPLAVRRRLEDDAVIWMAEKRGLTLVERGTAATVKPSRSPAWLPWLFAAAVIAVAVILGRPTGPDGPARLIARGAVVVPWGDNEQGVRGDVVWDRNRPGGFMRFEGLAANDASVEQYQLWIFDRDRDERYPVDGGVFDVPAGGGPVTVEIDPRLPVDDPTLFAITIEPPGGVVVSDRTRLILAAAVQ